MVCCDFYCISFAAFCQCFGSLNVQLRFYYYYYQFAYLTSMIIIHRYKYFIIRTARTRLYTLILCAYITTVFYYIYIYIYACVCVYYTIHIAENFYSCSSKSRRKWVPTGLVLHTVCIVGTLVWPDKPRPLSSHGVYYNDFFLLIRPDNWLSIYQPKMPVTRISESILYMHTNTIWPWKTQVLRRQRRCATPAPTRLVPTDHRYYYLQYVIILYSRRWIVDWVYASIISLI